MQEYETALKFTNAILKAEPSNRQAQQLEAYIQKKLRNGIRLSYCTLVSSVTCGATDANGCISLLEQSGPDVL